MQKLNVVNLQKDQIYTYIFLNFIWIQMQKLNVVNLYITTKIYVYTSYEFQSNIGNRIPAERERLK